MRYVLTIVEQLDRAASELETDHPINSRLALILIDNATELMLHRQCTDRLESDSRASGLWNVYQTLADRRPSGGQLEFSEDLRKQMMTPRQRSRARGYYLDDKLRVLEEMGDLSQSERRFIAIAHEYRNELYHVGLSHDDVIRAIAGQYFLLSCDLFVRMGNLGILGLSFSSSDKYTDVAERYLPMHGGRVDYADVDKGALAGKLRFALPEGLPNLANVLASNAQKSIAVIMDNFGFLVQDNPFGLETDKMLEVAQWQRDLTEALERENVDGLWADPNYRKRHAAVTTSLEANWRQRHNSIPCKKWMLRADAIEREADPLVAMASYQSLRNDMSYLEGAIETAANDLDHWIQMEIDIARGK